MVSKSESSLVLASTSHQDRVFRRDRKLRHNYNQGESWNFDFENHVWLYNDKTGKIDAPGGWPIK